MVLPKVDPAFRVGHPINDQGRIVGVGRQGQQMRQFLGVRVEGPFLRLAMLTHVRDVRRPPAGDFVQMFQGAKRAAVEQVLFDIQKRAFHFALRFWTPRSTGHRPVAIVGGERQEGRLRHRRTCSRSTV
jgi:hypothetical protein